MRQRHAQMFLTHRHQVESITELVQSTDQAAHMARQYGLSHQLRSIEGIRKDQQG
jgi:hypothetical protein